MFSKTESNDAQESTHTVLEESKAQRDSPSDDLMKASIPKGTYLYRLFNEILNLQSF